MMVALMVLVSIVGLTGWMMGTDRYWGVGWVEHVHETSANIIIVAALLHVAGAIVEMCATKKTCLGQWSRDTNGRPREAISIMRLLLIEDNARLAELIHEGLQGQGFAVDWCDTIENVELVQRIIDYDLLLLDLGLPDGDGLDLVRAMRRRLDTTPVRF